MLPEREAVWHPALLRLSLLADARLLFGWHARQLAKVSNSELLVRIRAEMTTRTGKAAAS